MANQSKLSGNKEINGNCSRDKTPAIPLKNEIKIYKKEDSVVIKCYLNLTVASSTTYNLSVSVFKEWNPKEWLKGVKNVKQAAKGQNMTTEPANFSLVKYLLDDNAIDHSKREVARMMILGYLNQHPLIPTGPP